jgi:uncharacterized protein (DUF302 family)
MVSTPTGYSLSLRTRLPFDEAERRVREGLRREGFGVLTEIDLRKAFAEKLNRSFRRYTILGACNPPLAFQAVSAELEIGTLLPCNVVIYEDGEEVVVSAMDPEAALSLVRNPEVREIAAEARSRLSRALQGLAGPGEAAG